jgi:hypothetical protein
MTPGATASSRPDALSGSRPRVVLVLQAQRLAALSELEETCRRARQHFGGCRVVVLADAMTSALIKRLGYADEVLRMSRWSCGRMRALLRRLERRGVTDMAIAYDSAALPGPARLEWLALASRKPIYFRETGGPLAPISRARLTARLAAEALLAALAMVAGAAVAIMVAGALLLTQPMLIGRRRREQRRRQRISAWSREWLRRL